MAVKEKDFVKIEYTGRVKEDGTVFDTTDQKLAEESGLGHEHAHYGAVTICVGARHILPALEKSLLGKEPGATYTETLPPEKAFGKKSAKLLRLIPQSAFIKQDIQPQPGLQVNLDHMVGLIRSVSSGRVIVDFNHPLSGREVQYEVKVVGVVTDPGEKAKALLEVAHMHDSEVVVADGKATVTSKEDVPKELQEHLSEQLKTLAGIASVDFNQRQV